MPAHFRRASPRTSWLLFLLAALAAALATGVIACGDDEDFPGTWVSARGERMTIAARDDGDYDVTFLDTNTERGEDMTFILKRDGDKLTVDYEEDGFFIYITLGGDKVTVERIGAVENFLREE